MANDRESHYQPPLSFHGIRFLSFLFNAIIAGILAYFLIHLKNDGFKLPWTLLIVFASSVFTLLYLVLSWAINACATLAPLFSLIINVPLLLLWLITFSLVTYNMQGTLGHSCNISNWGNSTGVTVCTVYKFFYTFIVFVVLSQSALVVLDLRARAQQRRGTYYDRMSDENKSVKMDTLDSSNIHTTAPDVPYGVDFENNSQTALQSQDVIYQHAQNDAYQQSREGVYQPQDDFYQQSHPHQRSRGNSYRSENAGYGEDRSQVHDYGRPAMYSRGNSQYQSSRSDVPMLQDYNYYGGHPQTSHQSNRQQSPYRY